MKKELKNSKFTLTLLFSFIIFAILLISNALSATILGILVDTKIISSANETNPSTLTTVILMAVISYIISAAFTFFVFKIPLKPVNNIIWQMNRLASGDFSVRINTKGILSSYPAIKEVTDSFNKMAEDLGKTEMLRSDFINNLSHEVKTPIVSIAGFAKLLKRGNLTDEQKAQYIDIIEEESLRLSNMATNLLNLTKIENQNILTGSDSFNLSEQIRSCVLLFEKSWTKKNIELGVEFPEHIITANEELLKQVWINLIDNAIKYTPEFGTINIFISQEENTIRVDVSNTGSEIPSDKIEQIWRKFYQADESHSSPGNGIGLAIVKKIVDLHSGIVSVKSENCVTTFTIELPK